MPYRHWNSLENPVGGMALNLALPLLLPISLPFLSVLDMKISVNGAGHRGSTETVGSNNTSREQGKDPLQVDFDPDFDISRQHLVKLVSVVSISFLTVLDSSRKVLLRARYRG